MQPTSLAQPYPTAQAPPQSTGDERPLKRLRASPGQLHADCARQNLADNANIPSLHASFACETENGMPPVPITRAKSRAEMLRLQCYGATWLPIKLRSSPIRSTGC